MLAHAASVRRPGKKRVARKNWLIDSSQHRLTRLGLNPPNDHSIGFLAGCLEPEATDLQEVKQPVSRHVASALKRVNTSTPLYILFDLIIIGPPFSIIMIC